MRKNHPFGIAFLLIVLPLALPAQVRLPQLIADHMVLQRDVADPIWGWAAPGEKIVLSFNGRSYKVNTLADGSWEIHLPVMHAGGPFTIDIRGSNHVVVSDVLFGDVWFCSGQSNMVLPMERVKEKFPEEIAGAAGFPMIRNFFVSTASDVAGVHADLPPGKWMETTPASILAFGAATWFFAKQLYQQYHIPIGIINSSVGGEPIQAWVSATGLKELPVYAERVARFKDSAFLDSLLHRVKPPVPAPAPDRPDRGLAGPVKWYDSSYVPTGWHKFWLPGFWADQGVKELNGVVWFRREIEVPASMAGKRAKLFVGRIIDADETYVNGVEVGHITYQYPPRRYDVPAGLLKSGRNVLTVRVTNKAGKGGFEPDKRYELTDGVTHLDIRGDWQYRVGQVYPFREWDESGMPAFSAADEPSGLYNTMVAPAVKTRIKGFVWYQGESNTDKPKEYQRLLPALIADWRSQWRQGELPFLYVQLPNFNEVQYTPAESQWAELREAQLDALSVPGTAMAVTIDIGEWNDIHPLDKKDVGERLALAARHLAYGEHQLVYSGPIYRAASVDGNKIIVRFTSVGGGLVAKGGGELSGFAIAGADKHFVWADARVEGDAVVVSSDAVPKPLWVRYAWADNPEGANLYNSEGLPASPFRTDEDGGWTAEQDHDNMMKQLGIKVLRPGPSGDEKAPNHANYDEALANPFPNLPDVLRLKDGTPVTRAADWWGRRRPEIVEDFFEQDTKRIIEEIDSFFLPFGKSILCAMSVLCSKQQSDGTITDLYLPGFCGHGFSDAVDVL
jgi:sialate O-acetylesterase